MTEYNHTFTKDEVANRMASVVIQSILEEGAKPPFDVKVRFNIDGEDILVTVNVEDGNDETEETEA